jgi:hypothetical protein
MSSNYDTDPRFTFELGVELYGQPGTNVGQTYDWLGPGRALKALIAMTIDEIDWREAE